MEAVGAASGIIGIVGFGLQIATSLQTYVEGTREADERIRAIANDVSATASALQQLHVLIEVDEKSEKSNRIFSDAGLRGVIDAAAQCDDVFRRIVELLNASGKLGEELSNPERSDRLRLGVVDQLKWPWLEPKILRCRQELERLLLKLLVMLQVINLAAQQKGAAQRGPKDYIKEEELRMLVVRLLEREKRAQQQLDAEKDELDDGNLLSDQDNADAGYGQVPNGWQSGSRDPDMSKDPNLDATTLNVVPPPVNSRPLHPPKPQPTELVVAGVDSEDTVEAFILKGDSILQVPLPQAEIRLRMERAMLTNLRSSWDSLLLLAPGSQAALSSLLSAATASDQKQRLFIGMEVISMSSGTSFSRLLKPKNKKQYDTVIVFIKVHEVSIAPRTIYLDPSTISRIERTEPMRAPPETKHLGTPEVVSSPGPVEAITYGINEPILDDVEETNEIDQRAVDELLGTWTTAFQPST